MNLKIQKLFNGFGGLKKRESIFYQRYRWRDFFVWNKRLFLLALLLSVFVLVNQIAKATTIQNPDVSNAGLDRLDVLKTSIQGTSSWKPNGWGSGEYIDNIPQIKAGAVLDFDSGNVIWSMNLKMRTATASLSKLATVTTALDLIPSDHLISVTDDAAGQVPTILGLIPGERLTLDEAIAGAIMTSGNDSAEAIADSIGQEFGIGRSGFMQLVNFKLSKIGAFDSHFSTATGLDSTDHYSTVYDLAILAHDAKANYPLIARDGANLYRKLDANQYHKLYDLPNWNALLGTYPGVDGLKIGYTEAAGYSTIVTAERNGHRLMAVVIGADSLENRDLAAAVLLNYGFKKDGVDEFSLNQLNLNKRYNDWKSELGG